mgnify:CR=1 FL=1
MQSIITYTVINKTDNRCTHSNTSVQVTVKTNIRKNCNSSGLNNTMNHKDILNQENAETSEVTTFHYKFT